MNKICIDNPNIILKNGETYFLEINDNRKYTIIVDKNIESRLVIIGSFNNYQLVINLYSNSKLIVNSLNNNINSNIIINLLETGANVIYNHSVIASINSSSDFSINHFDENTKSLLNCNGINLDNNYLYFNINGIIDRNSNGSLSSQNSKIINFMNGEAKIIPNFVIDNDDVIANHSAYIGNFPLETVFYVESRGISKSVMYKLLYRSLLLGNMDLQEEKELFNNVLKEWRLL